MNKIGSLEYDMNEGKARRIAQYRKHAYLKDEDIITEENLNYRAMKRVANDSYRPMDQIKCELLGLDYYKEN